MISTTSDRLAVLNAEVSDDVESPLSLCPSEDFFSILRFSYILISKRHYCIIHELSHMRSSINFTH
jgi:hypothetical protein